MAADKAAGKPAKKRKTQKFVRNLRNAQVKLLLDDQDKNNKPFRVFLKPRGLRGDWTLVPARLSEHPQLQQYLLHGVLEVITKVEADQIAYNKPAPPSFNGVTVSSVETFRDTDNSVTIGYVDEDGKMTRVPRAERQHDTEQAVDAATRGLIEKGVMPPLPKRT